MMKRSQFDSLMDCFPGAVICLDSRGLVHYANPEAQRLLGRNTFVLKGSGFVTTFCHDAVSDELEDGQVFEIRIQTLEQPRFLQCRVSRRYEDGSSPVAYMIAIEDRTEWYRINEERDRLMEMATISEVLPTILHEFKNPLASIQALVELMTEDCSDEALQGQLHSILMEIRRMKLGFEGFGSSTRNLASKRCQAVDYGIREACLIFERQLEARRIRLNTDIETTPLLPFDTGGVRGVLFNLLNNAKQACRPGDEIEVRAGLKDDGRTFFFSVGDTGPGMSPQTLEQCTKLFYTTKRMGSGIGLALCRTAVEKIRGRLEIQSTEGQGTLITVYLPLAS